MNEQQTCGKGLADRYALPHQRVSRTSGGNFVVDKYPRRRMKTLIVSIPASQHLM